MVTQISSALRLDAKLVYKTTLLIVLSLGLYFATIYFAYFAHLPFRRPSGMYFDDLFVTIAGFLMLIYAYCSFIASRHKKTIALFVLLFSFSLQLAWDVL